MSSRENERLNQKIMRIKQKKRKRRIRAFIFVACLCLVVLGVLCITVLFPIKNIVVKGETPYTVEEIIAASGIDVGDNVIVAGRYKASDRITKVLPYIKSVSFGRNLDGTLTINVKKAEEHYLFRNQDGNVIVDSDLKILKSTTEADKNLLVITYAGISGKPGESALFNDETDYTLFSLVEQKIKEHNLDVSVIDISKSYNITLLVNKAFIVQLGNTANLEEKINHLKTMLTKISSGKKGFIELSSWTSENEKAYFREKEIAGYFDEKTISPQDSFENVSENEQEKPSDS